MTHAFNPFQGKDLFELKVEDLAMLREVEESWYVEYKAKAEKADKVAKSITALANTYGGWLFYGVAEHSQEHQVAGSFPGLTSKEVELHLRWIRQGINTHSQPAPYFEVRTFQGPCASLGLQDAQSIVCVWVPWSPLAPHVHSCGRIFRRVADSSEPQVETSRTSLEGLWKRADEIKADYAHWIEEDPEFSEGESKRPFLRMLLVADRWRQHQPHLEVGAGEIRQLFCRKNRSLPFDNVYTSSRGFVARQLRNNDASQQTLTWHLRRNLVSEVIVPLNFYTGEPAQIAVDLRGYKHLARFVNLLLANKHSHARVINVNLLLLTLAGIAEIQEELTALAGWTRGYSVKARLLNVWRTIPFLDTEATVKAYEDYNLPLCLTETAMSPWGFGPDDFRKVSSFTDQKKLEHRAFLQGVEMLLPVAEALGIPWESLTEFGQIQEAAQRNLTLQRQQNGEVT